MLRTASEELRDSVLAELESDPKVESERIGVTVNGDVVHLSGTVPNFDQKWAAEEAAMRVKGVTAIVEDIVVDLPFTHERSDMDIARAVSDALYWDVYVPRTVQAAVERGHVTLTGEVEWNYEREEASSLARRILGVRGVTNRITLKQVATRTDVRGELQRIFHRDAQIDANNIRIMCEGGNVTLTGTVHSWFERNEASRAAWSVRGVVSVDNRIAVIPG